jgi:endogenous inhibitor of DNA gyrase (YacG/DUF329 family)
MTGDATGGGDRLAPDEAFAVLGNGIRMAILRALGETDDPLSFSALYDRVDVDDSSQFNYHLDRMVGHFVERTDAGYRLAGAGRRVVEAVLSGAVTDRPTLERSPVEEPCPYCGAPVAIEWEKGGVSVFCSACAGRYDHTRPPHADGDEDDGDGDDDVEGYLGRHPLPPAGVRGRDADEVLRAAWTWANLEILALASGLCPRCTATVEWEAELCERHDAGESGLCESCGGRHAVSVRATCTNCILQTGGEPVVALAAETELLALLTGRGLNPVSPASVHRVEAVHGDYEETILSREPLRARYTFAVEGERLSLTVDEELSIVESRREPPSAGSDAGSGSDTDAGTDAETNTDDAGAALRRHDRGREKG